MVVGSLGVVRRWRGGMGDGAPPNLPADAKPQPSQARLTTVDGICKIDTPVRWLTACLSHASTTMPRRFELNENMGRGPQSC